MASREDAVARAMEDVMAGAREKAAAPPGTYNGEEGKRAFEILDRAAALSAQQWDEYKQMVDSVDSKYLDADDRYNLAV